MKKIFLATAMVIVSSTTFAKIASPEKINNYLKNQAKVQNLINKTSKKHGCSEFEVTEVKTKLELLENEIELNFCIEDKSCLSGPINSKIELDQVKANLKLFKGSIDQIVLATSECGPFLSTRKGITTVTGMDNEGGSLNLIEARKF